MQPDSDKPTQEAPDPLAEACATLQVEILHVNEYLRQRVAALLLSAAACVRRVHSETDTQPPPCAEEGSGVVGPNSAKNGATRPDVLAIAESTQQISPERQRELQRIENILKMSGVLLGASNQSSWTTWLDSAKPEYSHIREPNRNSGERTPNIPSVWYSAHDLQKLNPLEKLVFKLSVVATAVTMPPMGATYEEVSKQFLFSDQKTLSDSIKTVLNPTGQDDTLPPDLEIPLLEWLNGVLTKGSTPINLRNAQAHDLLENHETDYDDLKRYCNDRLLKARTSYLKHLKLEIDPSSLEDPFQTTLSNLKKAAIFLCPLRPDELPPPLREEEKSLCKHLLTSALEMIEPIRSEKQRELFYTQINECINYFPENLDLNFREELEQCIQSSRDKCKLQDIKNERPRCLNKPQIESVKVSLEGIDDSDGAIKSLLAEIMHNAIRSLDENGFTALFPVNVKSNSIIGELLSIQMSAANGWSPPPPLLPSSEPGTSSSSTSLLNTPADDLLLDCILTAFSDQFDTQNAAEIGYAVKVSRVTKWGTKLKDHLPRDIGELRTWVNLEHHEQEFNNEAKALRMGKALVQFFNPQAMRPEKVKDLLLRLVNGMGGMQSVVANSMEPSEADVTEGPTNLVNKLMAKSDELTPTHWMDIMTEVNLQLENCKHVPLPFKTNLYKHVLPQYTLFTHLLSKMPEPDNDGDLVSIVFSAAMKTIREGNSSQLNALYHNRKKFIPYMNRNDLDTIAAACTGSGYWPHATLNNLRAQAIAQKLRIDLKQAGHAAYGKLADESDKLSTLTETVKEAVLEIMRTHQSATPQDVRPLQEALNEYKNSELPEARQAYLTGVHNANRELVDKELQKEGKAGRSEKWKQIIKNGDKPYQTHLPEVFVKLAKPGLHADRQFNHLYSHPTLLENARTRCWKSQEIDLTHYDEFEQEYIQHALAVTFEEARKIQTDLVRARREAQDKLITRICPPDFKPSVYLERLQSQTLKPSQGTYDAAKRMGFITSVPPATAASPGADEELELLTQIIVRGHGRPDTCDHIPHIYHYEFNEVSATDTAGPAPSRIQRWFTRSLMQVSHDTAASPALAPAAGSCSKEHEQARCGPSSDTSPGAAAQGGGRAADSSSQAVKVTPREPEQPPAAAAVVLGIPVVGTPLSIFTSTCPPGLPVLSDAGPAVVTVDPAIRTSPPCEPDDALEEVAVGTMDPHG